MASFLQAITLWLLAELILGSTNLDTIADYGELSEHRRTNIATFITCQSRWSKKYHFNVSFTQLNQAFPSQKQPKSLLKTGGFHLLLRHLNVADAKEGKAWEWLKLV